LGRLRQSRIVPVNPALVEKRGERPTRPRAGAKASAGQRRGPAAEIAFFTLRAPMAPARLRESRREKAGIAKNRRK
jgi:hypothetical protein